MRFILFFLLVVFSCIQCKNECIDENVKLGNVSFDKATLGYIDIYENIQSVSFISPSGEVRIHQISLQESTNPFLCVKVTCRPSYELEGLNGCEYYDAEDRHYILSSDELDIHVKAEIKLIENETEDYYDSINIGLMTADTSFFVGNVTAANFDNPINLNQSIFDEYFTPTVFTPFVNYERVQQYSSEDAILIYKKNKGLVFYKFDDVAWTLVE